ncbi:MAG: hypothetical protein OCU22_07030 [Canidatus Methanoxibalbensis ujae]|nr:hypothetical protein [Candidatus Methanoxibalbensis ujae]
MISVIRQPAKRRSGFFRQVGDELSGRNWDRYRATEKMTGDFVDAPVEAHAHTG